MADLKELEKKIDILQSEIKKTTRLLGDRHKHGLELQKFNAVEVVTVSFLVAIAVSSFSYLINFKGINTMLDLLLYIFMITSAPAAFFLLMFHAYSVYGIFKKQRKKIPFILDFAFLMYITMAILTTFILGYLYSHFNIPSDFLTSGWIIAGVILFAETMFAFIISFRFVSKKLTEKFPHIFPESKTKRIQKKQVRIRKDNKQGKQSVIKKTSNASIWENEDCFVKYKNKKKE